MNDQSERRFNRAPASVGAARSFVLAALPIEQARHRIDDITLCVSELATNALEHGTPTGHLFLVRVIVDEMLLRIEVHDAGDGRPRLQSPSDGDLSGRGLFLVDALADGWGTSPRDGLGKVVWVEFKLSAPVSTLSSGRQKAVEAYLTASNRADRLLLGTTRLRRPGDRR